MSTLGAGIWVVNYATRVYDCAMANISDARGAEKGVYERGGLLVYFGDGG